MNIPNNNETNTLNTREMNVLDNCKMNILSLLWALPLNPTYVT